MSALRNLDKKQNRLRLEKGQSLVEAAFGLIVIVFLMSAMIDLGRAYFTFVALEDAAGEAALFLSINPKCAYDGKDGSGKPLGEANSPYDTTTGTPSCEPPNNAVWRAQQAGGGLVQWSDAVVVTEITATATGTGDVVNVTIQYPFRLLLPVIPNIAGSPTLLLTSSASQTVVSE